jgi:hypothetical protein
VPFSNTGTVNVTGGGTLQLTGNVSQVIGPTLTNGTWATHAASTLSITGASITNNAANVILDGVGSSFDAINPINNNAGTFQVIGGRTFVTSGSYTNSGSTVIGAGSALDITGDLNNTGTIDVGGIMVINYAALSPQPTIAAQIASGYANGDWDGVGINSSLAAMNSGPIKTGIGYADAADLGIALPATFAGQPVDDKSLIVRYTLLGDSNLDAAVNAMDFNSVASNFGRAGAVWSQGDFNYDGVVNTADFTLLATNFNAAIPSPALGAIVPEPLALASIMLLHMSLRRRSRGITASGTSRTGDRP